MDYDKGQSETIATQLDAVVQEAKVYSNRYIRRSQSVASTVKRIAEDIQDIQFKHIRENKHLRFLLGYQDIPEQAQLPLTVDFNDCGHILLGSSSYVVHLSKNALIDVMRKTTIQSNHISIHMTWNEWILLLVDFACGDYFYSR